MIFLCMYRVVKSTTGKRYEVDQKIVAKLPEAEFTDRFALTDVKAWRKFLESYHLPDGTLLPRKTPTGDEVAYLVLSFGSSRDLRAMYPEGVFGPRNGVRFLFPGYDEKFKRVSIAEYGRLRG